MRAACLVAAALALTACNKEPVKAPPSDPVVAACTSGLPELGDFVSVPAGQFRKGAYAVYPEEAPDLILQVDAFEMLSHEVTNEEFDRFARETGYVTEAERGQENPTAASGSAVFQMPSERGVGSWALVSGATWRTPEGPGSDIAARMRHPVVHVTLADARAYADWAGARLPTEEEWEYAAAIGLPDAADPHSGAYAANGAPVANTWQGFFPLADEAADGVSGRAPVGCFSPSEIGLYDMIGNVWEWTETPFGERTHTIKGGSYLCAENFCQRYRPAARQPQEDDFSSGHIGFRIVR
jgi:formylglycine-generating enzyme required for sulfatase activity